VLYFRLVLLLLSIALIAGGLLYINSGSNEMLSFLIAYISSAIVVLVSFKNYQSMVDKRIESEAVGFDDRDMVDKLDDPYDLYSEESQESAGNVNIKEVIKEEKRALKKQKGSLKQLFKNSLYAFKFSRLFAYLLVVLGFFYLLREKVMVLGFYLSALIVPIIVVVLYLFIVNAKEFQKVER
jgi:hypothetical protein